MTISKASITRLLKFAIVLPINHKTQERVSSLNKQFQRYMPPTITALIKSGLSLHNKDIPYLVSFLWLDTLHIILSMFQFSRN